VLKKSHGNFFGGFLVTSKVQLALVRAIAAALDSRVTDFSFHWCRVFQHNRLEAASRRLQGGIKGNAILLLRMD
jgi:ribosomal protein S12 methylthiotransferase accessory factor YcaO